MQMFFANGEKVDEILGAVPEYMIRAKVEEIRQKFPSDEKGMLKVILGSWSEQNRRHSEKFEKWKQKAGNPGVDASYGSVFEAVKRLEEANGWLLKALTGLEDI
jgi:thioredoxin-like negative regulator of GroEL